MQKIINIEIKKLEELYKLDKLDELEKKTKKLLQIEKKNIVLLNILGVVYLKKKLFNKAELVFKEILDQSSDDMNALKNLGETYRKMNKPHLAIKYYELYLLINSKDNEVINNIASCHLKNKNYKLAINYYKDLIEKNPENEEYITNLAFALIQSSDIETGLQVLEKVLDKNISHKRAFSGYLQNQNFNPHINYNKLNNYIKKFNQTYKRKILNIVDFKFDKNPKKINLGFISPDFRAHPVGYCIRNIVRYLNLYNFNLYAYYNFDIEDNLTLEFKKNFGHFTNITKLSNKQIIDKVRTDGIHILIDLAGHTINNNLDIFYYKAAPIQMSWLGSMNTTGIKEMDYKIIDKHIFLNSMKKNYSERLLSLPNIWTDYDVFQKNKVPLTVNQNENDPIIFGSFVALRKINDNVISLWSKVLKKFSNTKIYFKARELRDKQVEKKFKEKFYNHGISSDRLILEESSDHLTYLKSYSKVHISLDPFPFNGVSTSFESIWMGVPVFCLKGNSALSRCSYSINKNLKMEDWIAENENDYLIKLEKILSNKKQLLLTKKNLRKKAMNNNLFNSKEFTKNLAILFNQAWKDFA